MLGFLFFALVLPGCAFNRADFVAGPNGQPDQSQMSDSGRDSGPVIRGLMGGRLSTGTSF
jgi:hypothetical protein